MGLTVRAELQKYFHTPGGAVSTLVWVALLLLIQWQTLNNVADGDIDPIILEPGHAFDIALPAMALLGMLLAPLTGAVIVGQEFHYGTWNPLLMQAGNRLRVFGAKFSAMVIVVLFWVVLGMGIGYVASLSYNGLFFGPPLTLRAAKQAGVILTGMLFWGTLAFAMAAAFRSTTAAAITGFLLPWIELWLSGIPGVVRWLPSLSYGAIAAPHFLGNPHGMTTFNLNPMAPPAPTAWTILTLEFTLIFLLGALAVRWTTQK